MRKKAKVTFALDIGTRSIVGLLLEETKEGILLKNIVAQEHSSRAMLDGQIHNIPQVSSLVKEVKKELEKESGIRLKKVSVAAAGRSLKTIKTIISHEYNNQDTISLEDILKLELKGAQKAQAILIEKHSSEHNNNYYCVGYSITKYFLDDYEIGSLVGQKGRKVGLEIVAAFLPKVVVDSLQTVLTDNGLELASITLEPIAAINAILPPTMRKLNLALVDVGAGTSDIAISYDGSIIAYGMVPIAGDEITEALCEKNLLDFNEGEKLKRKLNSNEDENIVFSDILGFEHSLKSAEIITGISRTIEALAQKISNEILKLNNKPPQAVILIGGGSQTPLLCKYLADLLGLPKQRVAVQRASSIKEINELPEKFQGPEIITPIGIGLTALKYVNLGFIPVQVNGYNINLLNLGRNTVLDALLAAGIETGRLYGKPGLALTVEVNGKLHSIPGTLGEKALVKVNEKEASLDTILKPKDKIEFIKAKDGKPGQGCIADLLPKFDTVKVNGEEKELPFEVTMDGNIVAYNQKLKDGSKIFYRPITQLGELLEYWNFVDLNSITKLTLILNGKTETLTFLPLEIKRDGVVLDLYENVQPKDELSIIKKDSDKYFVKQLLQKYLEPSEDINIKVSFNDKLLEIPIMDLEVKINDQKADLNASVANGDVLEVNYVKNKQPILVDIFTQFNFSLTPPPGKTGLEILINGEKAEYTAPLKNGDKINMIWK